MIASILSSVLIASGNYTSQSEQINRFCAAVVNIPYASDNFTDEEFRRFRYCADTLNQKNKNK